MPNESRPRQPPFGLAQPHSPRSAETRSLSGLNRITAAHHTPGPARARPILAAMLRSAWWRSRRRRRRSLGTLLLVTAGVAMGCRPSAHIPPELPPGTPVVLISIDTLRADHLPAYGYRGVATPA